MSVLFYPESIRILGSDANGNNVMLCEMAVDDIANLPAANAFINDRYVLSMGCKAIVINDNSVHRLNSAGQWVQQVAGTSSYTRSEIDALLLNKVDSSTYATDKAALDAEIAEDRAALVELVDGGAKNLLPLTGESTDIFTINADGTMTANGSSSTSKRDFAYYIGVPPKGRFVFSGCPPTGSNTTYRMFLQSVVGSTYTTLATLTGDSVEVDLTNIDKIRVLISIYGGYTPNNIKFSPMLCTKAEWDISHTYVPYAPTNRQLYEMILQLQG